MKLALILFFSVFLVSSCARSYKLNSESKDAIGFKEPNGQYYIDTLYDNNVSSLNITITFKKETKMISGSYGCNTFSGAYQLKGSVLRIDDLIITEIDCPNKVSDFEVKYLKALRDVNRLTSNGNSITLFKGDHGLIIAAKEATNNLVEIEYSSLSRGASKLIKVNNYGISIISSRQPKPISKIYNKGEWSKLLELVNDINLDSLSSLEPPSKNHQFDGASMAHLKIIFKNKVYKTQTFDHGNPNDLLKPLVKEILSLAKNIE